MQNPEEKVALQAVEFWATVCDEEQELALEAAEVSRRLNENNSNRLAKVPII